MTNVRAAPIFIADAKGLDFLNSVATPVDTPVEWLGSGDDLLAWLKEAHLVPADVLKALKTSALPGELDAVAAQARALREWFRGFVQKHKGKTLNARALQQIGPLNRILERDDVFGQVVPRDHNSATTRGSRLMWLEQRRWRSPESLIQPIAREMANVICNEDFSLIRACGGHACTLMFVDRTKSHRRRWCSMVVCGNRAKQAALRERLR
jgi:predicted RNA-binding Zn ribbon-like protein